MPQKYPRPPIIEAAFHVRYRSPLTDGELKRIPRLLAIEYPKSREEADFQLQFRVEKGVPVGQPTPETTDNGARMLSADDQRVVVTRRGSVMYSCLAPYPGWDSYVAGAHFVFDTLREKLDYKEVSSVGLRYVNRLDIPVRDERHPITPGDYLLVGVALPHDGVSDSVRSFQVISEINLAHDQLIGRVVAATAQEALIDHVSLLFDIDIIAQVEVPRREDEFWALVGRMREAKNAIFESGLTNKARRLFGWVQ